MPDLNLDLPSSEHEAEERFLRYEFLDPFPEIPPALLNIADVMDYVAAVGMLWPFDTDPSLLKPASYEVRLSGEYVYWDEHGEQQSDLIEDGFDFVLPANSITFVSPEPVFRLPSYIAIRFNLRIKHIHQGILLGTGPLVDPGFRGRLAIPLHNLTTNDYVLRGGDGLIWMEFTKLSRPHTVRPSEEPHPRRGTFIELPPSKRNLTLRDYLRKADENRPVRSSIPGMIAESAAAAVESRDAAKAAEGHARSIQNRITAIGVAAVIGLIFAAVALIAQMFSIMNDINARIDGLQERILPPAESPASMPPPSQTIVPPPPPAGGTPTTTP
jgi:deoxycytidine triphosphate deaminase